MNLIFFDFEIFSQDTLLGALIYEEDQVKIFQTWSLEEIKKFYKNHETYLWIGHNNIGYDNIILGAILNNENPYHKSQEIINVNNRYNNTCIPKFYYDLMDKNLFYSLKATEAAAGEKISETQVDFNLNRKLTEQEKKLTESYNQDDLNRTFKNFMDPDKFGKFRAKLSLVQMFNLPFNDINDTEAKLAEKVLKAEKIWGIEKKYVKPPIYENLQLKNKELWDFYFREGFRKQERIKITICGEEISIGSGGVHSAIKKFHAKKCLYIDVSGYYNLTMLNYNLLPRTLNEESKATYKEIYHKQLEYKKTDPLKREPLKIILLAVFGAMMQQYSNFYDPQIGSLVTITGQLFICDLLEKLEGKIILVQSNTDGIVVIPKDWSKLDEIKNIIEQWEKRTGYNCKKEFIYDLVQRDVNNYMYRDDKGEINVRGEALKQFSSKDRLFYEGKPSFTNKESAIISIGIVEYYMNHKLPEETVKENENNLKYFQQICRKNSYDFTTLSTFDLNNNLIKEEELQGINRVFASKEFNTISLIYKHKISNNKHTKAIVANLPDNIFVYDEDILNEEAIKNLKNKINWSYYINRIYERILEFKDFQTYKTINI